MKSQSKNVFVAMSGGVDSSVAAVLLKKQGFNVVGVFMKPWSLNLQGRTLRGSQSSTFSYCLWQQDREDALRAASVIGIPLLTWDFSQEYKKDVVNYMIREYKAGRTPNPDVMCNKEIKFGLFLKKALKEGADYIATGHYVRLIKRGPAPTHPQGAPQSAPWGSPSRVTPFNYHLYMARDKNKDQSYFLWTLTQEQSKYCLFPIGDYTKPEVRKMAKKFELPNHGKKDSQGVCFIGPLDMGVFLRNYIKPRPGKIIDSDGRTVSRHDGVYYYTIGQRHGLNITNGQGPYYVIAKNLKKNIIYVGKEKDLGGKEAKIAHINWVNSAWKSDFQAKRSVEVDVKVRYRAISKKAVLYKNGSLKFKSLIRAVTPGQSAVFYRGVELLGGGVIC